MKKQSLSEQVFIERNCPNAEELLNYNEGKLDDNDAWKIESHLQSCTLCSDALEGMTFILGTASLVDIANRKDEVIFAPQRKIAFRNNMIMLGTVSLVVIFFLLSYFNKQKTIVPPAPAPVEKTIPQTKVSVQPEKLIPVISSTPKKVPSKKKMKVVIPVTTESEILDEGFVKSGSEITTAIIEEPESNFEKPVEEPVVEKVYSSINSAMDVIYIQDLKVIDYSEIYSEFTDKPKPVLKSTAPEFENLKDKSKRLGHDATQNDTIYYRQMLELSLAAFKEKKYSLAITGFQSILHVYPDDQNAIFYAAISNFELNKYGAAEAYLNKILYHRLSPFQQEAEWYLALTYYKTDEMNQCKEYLELIVKHKGFYAERAERFLKELK